METTVLRTGLTPYCRISLAYDGRARTWTYSEDYSQFSHLMVGAAIEVLVDPTDPTNVYTAHDVEVRFNAGWGRLAITSIAIAVVGALGLVYIIWLWRRRGSGEAFRLR